MPTEMIRMPQDIGVMQERFHQIDIFTHGNMYPAQQPTNNQTVTSTTGETLEYIVMAPLADFNLSHIELVNTIANVQPNTPNPIQQRPQNTSALSRVIPFAKK
jgi:hypothetical protein